MTAVIDAVYRGGVFCPATPPDLPEGTAVRLTVVPATPARPLLGLLAALQQLPDNPDAPTDGAAQHDHYLYGTPKRP